MARAVTHRVGLELSVDVDPQLVDPEEWDLQDLLVAMAAGLARPLRTIKGRVLDEEHDRMSATLHALADHVEELAEVHWLATAAPAPVIAGGRRRPSLVLLAELEGMAEHARRVADSLQTEDL